MHGHPCRYAAVEEDCSTALAIDENYVKAYLRRGVARRHLGKCSAAIQGNACCFVLCSQSILFGIFMTN